MKAALFQKANLLEQPGLTPKTETLGNRTIWIKREVRVRKWKRNKPEFKKQALERMKETKNIIVLVKELGVARSTLYRWRDEQLGNVAKKVRAQAPVERSLETEIQQLKQSLVNRTLEVDFFKGALQRVKARRQPHTTTGGEASTTKSKE
jgi:transposase-like protein